MVKLGGTIFAEIEIMAGVVECEGRLLSRVEKKIK